MNYVGMETMLMTFLKAKSVHLMFIEKNFKNKEELWVLL